MKEYIELGQFVKVHGINGELKLYPWCDDVTFVTKLTRLFLDENGKNQAIIELARTNKNMCLIKLEGINSVDDAKLFVEKIAYFARKDVKLPKGRFFVQDVLDCDVIDEKTSENYGKIIAITHPSTSDIYEIKNTKGQTFLFPAVSEFLGEINIEERFVKIGPIKGMFDNLEDSDDAN